MVCRVIGALVRPPSSAFFVGLASRSGTFSTNQVGSLTDFALRPRYKRLYNTVSHTGDKPRLIEVRPDGKYYGSSVAVALMLSHRSRRNFQS